MILPNQQSAGGHAGWYRTVDPEDVGVEFGYPVVFTSGCFDVVHGGHVAVLRRAMEEARGGFLFVAVNSDESVARLKGPGRPIVPLADRMAVVDAIVGEGAHVFPLDTDDPTDLLDESIQPTVIVKGGDYREEDVPEAKGRRLVLVPHTGQSTTDIVSGILGT